MESTEAIIKQISAGNTLEAQDGIFNELSSRAMEALEAKKQEVASNLFNKTEEE